jgi:hypothetical protein
MDMNTQVTQLVDYLGEYLIDQRRKKDSDYHFG